MSSPGYFYDDGQQKQPTMQQQLAMALMNNGGQQQQQSPAAGIGQAILMKALQNKQSQQAYNQAPPMTANIPIQGINGQMQTTQLSQKLPYMGPTGLSGLFNFGGGK